MSVLALARANSNRIHNQVVRQLIKEHILKQQRVKQKQHTLKKKPIYHRKLFRRTSKK